MQKLMVMTGAAILMASSPTFAQDASEPAGPAATQPAAPTADLIATAQSQGQFNTLARAIEAAGMTEQLKAGEYVTLFAPTDAAFASLPPGTLDNLLKPENQAELKALLANHLVPGFATTEFLAQQDDAAMRTVGGGLVTIETADGKVQVSGANVVKADVRASNGLIHGIDKVLLPAADQQARAAGSGALAAR